MPLNKHTQLKLPWDTDLRKVTRIPLLLLDMGQQATSMTKTQGQARGTAGMSLSSSS